MEFDPVLFESVAAAMVTAIATVWVGSKQLESRIKTDITAAEIKDRSEFRQQLMDQIHSLHEELAICKAEHREANRRICVLENQLANRSS